LSRTTESRCPRVGRQSTGGGFSIALGARTRSGLCGPSSGIAPGPSLRAPAWLGRHGLRDIASPSPCPPSAAPLPFFLAWLRACPGCATATYAIGRAGRTHCGKPRTHRNAPGTHPGATGFGPAAARSCPGRHSNRGRRRRAGLEAERLQAEPLVFTEPRSCRGSRSGGARRYSPAEHLAELIRRRQGSTRTPPRRLPRIRPVRAAAARIASSTVSSSLPLSLSR
jgi:hypothetical protein